MPKLTINDQEIEVENGMSVLQACELAGVEIPRFCYHDRLSVPANCRMCLVEQEGVPKPMPSCAIPAADNMVIKTDSEMVHKARRGVMEFLLINHPLDCPICDQGGECDLQDQAMAYGFDRSRFQEQKRAVKDKELGPLIKTVLTRCIHCTRCLRFGEQIGGATELGLLGRGEDTEIGTFVESFVSSELSGNLVDVCPVGALTSKPYAFKARPWELRKTESIDVMDAVGSHIRVDTRSNAEVMRIMPRLCEDINEEWISDKTRYCYDGLMRQRLDRPYLRNSQGRLEEVDWETALAAFAEKIQATKPIDTGVIVGDQVDCESVTALRDLTDALKIRNRDCRQDGAQYPVKTRHDYIMNTPIADIDQADAVLLVGTNPRHEATMVNVRIRKAFYERQIPVGVIGPDVDLTYDTNHLGDDLSALGQLAQGKGEFAKTLKAAKNPMIIVGTAALVRDDGAAIHDLAKIVAQKYDMIRSDWNGFNVLQMAAARVGALDLGFLPIGQNAKAALDIYRGAEKGQIKLLYLVGADELPLNTDKLKRTFVVYQGHHGDKGASCADLILPGAAYTEKNATFVNTEGRPQRTRQAMMPLGLAKEDWKIVRALSEHIDKTLPYNTLFELQKRMETIHPNFALTWQVVRDTVPKAFGSGKAATITKDVQLDKALTYPIENYYMTDVITRHSEIMAQCTRAFVEGKKDYKKAA